MNAITRVHAMKQIHGYIDFNAHLPMYFIYSNFITVLIKTSVFLFLNTHEIGTSNPDTYIF